MMFETVLDYIARTNLFNFMIFAGVIIYLIIKLNVKESLQKGAESVAEKIDNSKAAKKESESNLSDVENKVLHLKDEIDKIIMQSENNAKLVGDKIIIDANNTAENIKNNSLKLIENKTAVLKNDIMRRASLASVEVAKDQIINELSINSDLHNKLIDESIEAIKGVEL